MIKNAGPLAGRGIVVTRPAHQAAQLAGMIRDAGGNPILFPVLEILDVADLQLSCRRHAPLSASPR